MRSASEVEVRRFVAQGGAEYLHASGRLHGAASPPDGVVGLERLCEYVADFDLYHPKDSPEDGVLIVEAENRGQAVLPFLLDDIPVQRGIAAPARHPIPFAYGSGFLLDGRRSYARVQWQAGVAAGVPETAQGVGQVIVRDFARMLSDAAAAILPNCPVFARRILSGSSQSAWFVNAFVAEGFNADPASGKLVFQAAVTKNGAGNWLAINQLNGAAPQTPYLRPDGRPLTPSELLTRPDSDPFLVDIAEYTDYYRLRASLSASQGLPEIMRRYDWPSPHAPAFLLEDEVVFGVMNCNGGEPTARSALDCRPYLRAVFAGLDQEMVGQPPDAPVRGAFLPLSRLFDLGPAPATSPLFNGLDGAALKVPLIDALGQPAGGVRFPDVEHPLGRLEPPALPPCDTAGIASLCGNFGGFQPFAPQFLIDRHRSAEAYVSSVADAIDRLIDDRRLLAVDRAHMIEAALRRFWDAQHG